MISLEKPVETAMLMSLAGVDSLCANQWHCNSKENSDKIQQLMKGKALLCMKYNRPCCKDYL